MGIISNRFAKSFPLAVVLALVAAAPAMAAPAKSASPKNRLRSIAAGRELTTPAPKTTASGYSSTIRAFTQAERFVTPWTGYQTQTFVGGADVHSVGTGFVVSAQARLSSTFSTVVLGNVRELWVGAGALRFGRLAADRSIVERHGLHDQTFAQSVCFTAFDCVYGGPIGVHYVTERLRASLHLVNVPNVRATPSIGADGKIRSTNRWADAPVDTVELGDGTKLPIRHSLTLADGLKPLFYPGASAAYSFIKNDASGTELRALGQFAIHNARVTKRQALGFANGPSAEALPEVVVDNAMVAKFHYEKSLGLQFRQELAQGWHLSSEATAWAGGPDVAQMMAVAIGSASFLLSPRLVVGSHLGKTAPRPFVQMNLGQRVGILELNLKAEMTFARNGQATYVGPEAAVDVSKSLRVFAFAHLVRADESALFYGNVRGSDYYSVGMSYEF